MGSVSVAVPRATAVGNSGPPRADAAAEFGMGSQDAGVDHVGVHSCACRGRRVGAGQGQRALIDAVQAPRCRLLGLGGRNGCIDLDGGHPAGTLELSSLGGVAVTTAPRRVFSKVRPTAIFCERSLPASAAASVPAVKRTR